MYLLLFFVAAVFLNGSRYECVRMLKVIPGVPRVTYIYAPYVEGVMFNVRRYGRKSEYYVNLEFTTKYDFGDNVSGKYRMHNMSFDREFPNVFPFEQGKGEFIATFISTGRLIAKGDLGLTFKQRNV